MNCVSVFRLVMALKLGLGGWWEMMCISGLVVHVELGTSPVGGWHPGSHVGDSLTPDTQHPAQNPVRPSRIYRHRRPTFQCHACHPVCTTSRLWSTYLYFSGISAINFRFIFTKYIVNEYFERLKNLLGWSRVILSWLFMGDPLPPLD